MKKNEFYYDMIVLGGGAAGLAAAAEYAARTNGAGRTAVIEKENKLGRKLLATGNGRCNITNLDMSEEFYNIEARSFVRDIVSRITPRRLMQRFETFGLLCRADSAGRVYPYSNQAASVLDVLTLCLEKAKTDIFCGTRAEKIVKRRDTFELHCNDRIFYTGTLILACGGRVQKNLGSDGSSYEFARQLDLKCVPVFPSLAPAAVSDRLLHYAKGVRVPAVVSLYADGVMTAEESGELQLNEKNISGICVFQLSRCVNEFFAKGTVGGKFCKRVTISADLAPELTEGKLSEFFMKRRRELPDRAAEELFTGILNRKLGIYLLERCGVASRSRTIGDISDKEISQLVDTVKRCEFIPSGMSGENTAQVTAGGISLDEIDRNMRSKKYGRLYIVGESLDVDGLCGGYNLHFAFSSGIIAGTHAAKNEVKRNDKNK